MKHNESAKWDTLLLLELLLPIESIVLVPAPVVFIYQPTIIIDWFSRQLMMYNTSAEILQRVIDLISLTPSINYTKSIYFCPINPNFFILYIHFLDYKHGHRELLGQHRRHVSSLKIGAKEI